MTYLEAITYINEAEKLGSRPGLDTIKALLRRLGDPQRAVPVVHVAGTNGKGSVTAYIACILSAAGYRVGRFTSPDLHAFPERISINGQDIPEERVAELTSKLAVHAAEMARLGEGSPTIFELSTAMAFLYFKEQGCDLVVLEVGLGGRLDCTNVVENLLAAVITPIGMDHMAVLGDTLAKIAGEKAGIIKPGCPVASAWQEPEADRVIRDTCRTLGGLLSLVTPDLVRVGPYDMDRQFFDYGPFQELSISLLGEHQVYNAALAVQAVLLVRGQGFSVPEDAIRRGLSETSWPGRFELLHRCPVILADGAHNPHGVHSLAESLKRYFPGRRVAFLAGVLADKDFNAMFQEILPLASRFYTVAPPSKRALSAGALAAFLKTICDVPVTPADSVSAAMEACLAAMNEEEIFCAFGSLYYIDEVRRWVSLRFSETRSYL